MRISHGDGEAHAVAAASKAGASVDRRSLGTQAARRSLRRLALYCDSSVLYCCSVPTPSGQAVINGPLTDF